MLLREKGELVSDGTQLASIMSTFFINITKSSKLKEDQLALPLVWMTYLKNSFFTRVLIRLEKLIKGIKFSFQQVTEEHVRQVILSIDDSKATAVGDIPADMLKVTLDMHLSLIKKITNLSFENGCFPEDLKLAEVSPVFRKNDDIDKENCRPVSVLFNVSKVFE